MAIRTLKLPLFRQPVYNYNVRLGDASIKLRFAYNERVKQWQLDVSHSDGTPLVVGQAVVASYPMMLDYSLKGINGYFEFRPIGMAQNETISNPYEIWKYYELFYVYDDGLVES